MCGELNELRVLESGESPVSSMGVGQTLDVIGVVAPIEVPAVKL